MQETTTEQVKETSKEVAETFNVDDAISGLWDRIGRMA